MTGSRTAAALLAVLTAIGIAIGIGIGIGGCTSVDDTRDRSRPPVFEDVDGVPTATIDVDRPLTRAEAGLAATSTVRVVGSGLRPDLRVVLELDGTVLDLPATDVSLGSFDSSATAPDDPVEFVDIVDRVPYADAVARWREDVERFGADPDELAAWEAQVAALPEEGSGVVEEGYDVEYPEGTLTVTYRTAPERDVVAVTHRVHWGDR